MTGNGERGPCERCGSKRREDGSCDDGSCGYAGERFEVRCLGMETTRFDDMGEAIRALDVLHGRGFKAVVLRVTSIRIAG